MPSARDAFEGKGPQRQPQKRLDRRLEEVAKAVGGGYCRLQMPLKIPLKMALAVTETVAARRLGALEGGVPPPFQCIPAVGSPPGCTNTTAKERFGRHAAVNPVRVRQAPPQADKPHVGQGIHSHSSLRLPPRPPSAGSGRQRCA